MNKRLFLFVCWIFIHMQLFPQTGSITNIRVSQRTDGSGSADVYFNLTGTASSYYIKMEVSFNNGSTFTDVPSTYLSGNAGVSPGTNRHIIWNGKGSNNNTFSIQTKVKLIANVVFPCGQSITDTRDLKTYNTILIGTQCWMKENMNIGAMIDIPQEQANNAIIEKYCYNNLEAECSIYGGLYQWAELVQYLNGATNTFSWNPIPPGNIQGICPLGWHLPTDDEWLILTTYLGGELVAGGKMKESGNSHWNSPNTGATNESGFTSIPGGIFEGGFYTLGLSASLWSSSERFSNFSWSRSLNWLNGSVGHDNRNKTDGLSCRCINDDCLSYPAAGVSIVASTNPTSIGASATFTASAVNGGTVPIYQWKVNGTSVGINNLQFTYTPENNDIVTCTVTSSLFCVSNNPATSNSISMIATTTGPACPGIPTITYGGKIYNTIQIGTQCWMKENLNIGTRINGAQEQRNNAVIEKYCFDNLESNCDVFGGLYQWNEMMLYTTTPGAQGICPQGWHIPTEEEWCIVTQFLDPTVDCNAPTYTGTNVGGKMKETGQGHWSSPNTGATNESGFTALPCGYCDASNGHFGNLSYGTHFWSSTESSSTAWYLTLTYETAYLFQNFSGKTGGISSRCVKD